MEWKPQHPAFQALLTALLQQTRPVYVVGGVVRDHLLGRQQKVTDLDIVVERSALAIGQRVADQLGWAYYPLDEARDVARLVFTANPSAPLACDIAGMRGGTIENDLLYRDFTINAMAFAIENKGGGKKGGEKKGEVTLLDPWRGQADLSQRQLRRVSAASMADDPVRMLRAVRFAVQLGFTIEEQTLLQIKRMCSTITLASAERVRDELWKMMAADRPTIGLETLQSLGLLTYMLPELATLDGLAQSYPHHEDGYQHTLRVVRHAVQLRNWLLGRPIPDQDEVTASWQQKFAPLFTELRHHFTMPLATGHLRAEWLVWHALLHDIGKAVTRTAEPQPDNRIRYRFLEHERVGAGMAEQRLNALRFSRQEVQLAATVIANHMRPHLLSAAFTDQSVSKRASYRFYRSTGSRQSEEPAGLDTLLLAIADYSATYRVSPPPNWDAYLTHIDQLLRYGLDANGLAETKAQPLVDGHTLMRRLGLPPGRQVGQLLEQLLEAQAAGEVATTEEALTLASEWLRESKGKS
ncbi:MAG: HD domain-containing protein [Caldilineaceae bacterium]